MTMTKNEAVVSFLNARFPDAKCALHFANPFQCLIAVSLSAQTNDKSVNEVTPALFLAYPDPFALAKADPREVEGYIKRLGLYHNKAKHLVDLANALVNQFMSPQPPLRSMASSPKKWPSRWRKAAARPSKSIWRSQ